MRRPPRIERLAGGLLLPTTLDPFASEPRIPIPKPDTDPQPPALDPPEVTPPHVEPPDITLSEMIPPPGRGRHGSSDTPFRDTEPEGDDPNPETLTQAIESLLEQLTNLGGTLPTSSGASTIWRSRLPAAGLARR